MRRWHEVSGFASQKVRLTQVQYTFSRDMGVRRSQWCSQPKNLGRAKKIWGGKMCDFRRTTLFCFENRLSKHKM